MMPEGINTLFAEVSELFAAIAGQPTDADLHKLRKVLFPILLDILYDLAEGKQNLVGRISDDTDYNKYYGIRFVRLARKAAYDNTLAKNANNVFSTKSESTWKAAIAKERLYDIVERKT